MYSVIDGVLPHPIPFSESERLVALSENAQQREECRFLSESSRLATPEPDIRGDRGYASGWFHSYHHGQPETIMGLMVSSNFFSTLRVQPLFGRTFTREEDQRGANPLRCWVKSFGNAVFRRPANYRADVDARWAQYAIVGIVPASIRMESRDSFSMMSSLRLDNMTIRSSTIVVPATRQWFGTAGERSHAGAGSGGDEDNHGESRLSLS
jgi:hypothetical protein